MHTKGPHVVKRSKKISSPCVASLTVFPQRRGVFTVVKGEVQHPRECWAENIEDLSH